MFSAFRIVGATMWQRLRSGGEEPALFLRAYFRQGKSGNESNHFSAGG